MFRIYAHDTTASRSWQRPRQIHKHGRVARRGRGSDFDDFDIALAKREIATRERLWVPDRAQMLREALNEEWGWRKETTTAISRAVKDLEEGAIYAWDASRDYDLMYEHGKLIYGTRDFGSLEDDLAEQGVWVEGVSMQLSNYIYRVH